MRFLALDPSVNNVGWTTFDSSPKKPKDRWKFGTWHLQGHNRVMRIVDLVQHIREEIPECDHLVIEYPMFYNSARGHIAAHKSYTIDLGYICGYVAGALGFDHRNCHQPTAIEWKGTVSKEITARKFFRIFGLRPSQLSEHAIDAAMMLRYFLLTHGKKIFRAAHEAYPEDPTLRL